MDAPDNRTRAQRREAARQRVGMMLSLAECLKYGIGPAEVHRTSPRRLSAQGARFVATYSLLVRQGLEVLAGVMADETDDAGQPLTDKSLAAFTEDAENFMLATWGIPKPPAWWRDQDWDYPTQSEHTG
jgi:hypothetical protein